MGGKVGFRSYPRHLGKPTGRGIQECDASGFIRRTADMTEDHRQGSVAKDFADVTPGFGTRHPQDVVQLGILSDPTPIPGNSPLSTDALSKQDLGISDQEVEASIREGRLPRPGY